MEPTLTLQIPFILLGRRDTCILDPCLLPHHEQLTQPINLILQTLQHFCPTVTVHPWALDTFDWDVAPPAKLTAKAKRAHIATQAAGRDDAQRSAEEKWHALTSGVSERWILRPAPSTCAFLSDVALHGWREGDGHVSAAEAARLGGNGWACPVVLQRFGVPVDTASAAWTRFVRQTRALFCVLRSAFVDFRGTVAESSREVRYWDLVVGEKCFLKTVVGHVDGETGHKMLMLVAAFERELDMLRSTEELVQFVGVGRWLEWMLLRKMARVQREAWRCLEEAGRGEEQWKHRLGVEEERYRRTKGRPREWWDVVHDMDETEIGEGMRKFENNGKIRLGTALHRSPNHAHQFTFQGRRSTLDAGQLIAYTELLARIVDTAQTLSLDALAEQLENFQLDRPPNPLDSFSKMLRFLDHDSSDPSQSALTACLNPIDCTARSERERSALLVPQPKQPREAGDPFHDVRTYLETKHEVERADMVGFIERYSRAGGYRPTTDEKLLAMLRARGDRREEWDCGGKRKI